MYFEISYRHFGGRTYGGRMAVDRRDHYVSEAAGYNRIDKIDSNPLAWQNRSPRRVRGAYVSTSKRRARTGWSCASWASIGPIATFV